MRWDSVFLWPVTWQPAGVVGMAALWLLTAAGLALLTRFGREILTARKAIQRAS
jgi:hypothetical protein